MTGIRDRDLRMRCGAATLHREGEKADSSLRSE
jgi:hypothetical protein